MNRPESALTNRAISGAERRANSPGGRSASACHGAKTGSLTLRVRARYDCQRTSIAGLRSVPSAISMKSSVVGRSIACCAARRYSPARRFAVATSSRCLAVTKSASLFRRASSSRTNCSRTAVCGDSPASGGIIGSRAPAMTP